MTVEGGSGCLKELSIPAALLRGEVKAICPTSKTKDTHIFRPSVYGPSNRWRQSSEADLKQWRNPRITPQHCSQSASEVASQRGEVKWDHWGFSSEEHPESGLKGAWAVCENKAHPMILELAEAIGVVGHYQSHIFCGGILSPSWQAWFSSSKTTGFSFCPAPISIWLVLSLSGQLIVKCIDVFQPSCCRVAAVSGIIVRLEDLISAIRCKKLKFVADSVTERFPDPAGAKQAQTLTTPPPCLIVDHPGLMDEQT